MKHQYSNVNSEARHATFRDYDDEGDLLKAIREWWLSELPAYPLVTLNFILMTWDEKGAGADVFYTTLSQEVLDRLDAELTEVRPLEFNEKRMSTN